MTGTTRLGWVRHGMTEWNLLGKIQGITDVPLSADGIKQAELLADRLKDDRFVWDGVISSDLMRAKQTGQALAERLGIPHLQDYRLRERAFGSAEGTTEAERLARWGADWRHHVPDQETDAQVCERAQSFMEDWLKDHEGQSWLIVSHGGFLAKMLLTLQADMEDRHLLNTSLTIMERDLSGWRMTLHNCTTHLITI